MGSGRGWPVSAGGGCWRRGAKKGVGACPHKAVQARPEAAAARGVHAKLAILKRRADFLRVAAARLRAATPGLVVQAAPGPAGGAVRVGFTATRKLGGAVVRNRAKRRLRAVAGEVLAERGKPGTDYVLIARRETAERPYPALVADLETALRRLGRSPRPAPAAVAEKENP